MAEYYFPVSALPYLSYDGDPPITVEAFLESCETAVSGADKAVLFNAKLKSPDSVIGKNPTCDAWSAWERSLRSEIARLRAQRKAVDPVPFVKQGAFSQLVLDTARSVFAEASPEAAEEILLRALWRFLDDLEVGHHFDLDKLIVYYLKLQILDLKRMRNKEDGRRNFSFQYESIRAKPEQ